MKDRIYISGPVTGLDYETAAAAFYHAEREISSRYGSNIEVVNPVRLCRKEWTWEQCMRVCIVALTSCNYIHMLSNYWQSEGARLELTIAEKLHFGVCNDKYDLVSYGE